MALNKKDYENILRFYKTPIPRLYKEVKERNAKQRNAKRINAKQKKRKKI